MPAFRLTGRSWGHNMTGMDLSTLNTRLEQLERRVNVLTFVAWANTIAILVHALTRLAS